MYDWIIEADLYRLNKAFHDASGTTERSKILTLINSRRQALADLRGQGYQIPLGARQLQLTPVPKRRARSFCEDDD